jgi:putative ABC transport system permease protein
MELRGWQIVFAGVENFFLFNTAFSVAAFVIASLLRSAGHSGWMNSWRPREIGVRMALGANRRAVLRLFLREGAILTGAGLALGLVLAGLVAQLVRGILFEVSPFDPLVFGTSSALLVGAALIACWLPALRATRVDPMEALRRG